MDERNTTELIEKEKQNESNTSNAVVKKKIPKWIIPIGACAIVLIIIIIVITSSGKVNWPDTDLGNAIPKIEGAKGEIYDFSDSLSIDLENISADKYKDYISKCKKMGYIIDANESSDTYFAYNAEGYKIDISYYSDGDMSIYVYKPIQMSAFSWPKSEIAKLLPIPKSDYGKIERESEYGFVVYVGNTSLDDYNEYVDSVYALGFTMDYSKGDDYFYADNADGYSVSIKFEGFNIMWVRIDEPDEEDDPETNNGDNNSDTSNNNNSSSNNNNNNNNNNNDNESNPDNNNSNIDSSDSFDGLEELIINDITQTINQTNLKWQALKADITDYDEYVDNAERVEEYYDEINDVIENTCIRMQKYTVQYAELIMESDMSNDDKYDKFEDLLDCIYEDAFDSLYSDIYEDLLDDMRESFYEGVLNDSNDGSSYSEWYDVHFEEYSNWYDTRSDVYNNYYDARVDIYSFYYDMRIQLWNDNIDEANDILIEYKEYVEDLS